MKSNYNLKQQCSVVYYFFLFLIVPSSFYIFGFFPAPYYIFFVISFLILFFNKGVVRINGYDYLIFFITFIFIIYISSTAAKSNYNEMVSYIMSLIMLAMTFIFKAALSDVQKIKLLKYFIFFSSVVYSVDLCYRLLTPNISYLDAIELQGVNFRWFYAYKHSFIFQDSNFSGLVLSVIAILVYSSKRFYSHRVYLYYNFIFILLLFFTFSRAAIISYVFVMIMILFFQFVKKLEYRVLVVLFFSIITILSYYLFLSDIEIDDASVTIKIMMFKLLESSFESLSVSNFLFGWGLGKTVHYIGFSAHNLYITLFFELGFLGVGLYIFLFSLIIVRYKKMLPCFVVFSISSMSFGVFFPPLFAVFSLYIIMNEV